MKIRDAKQSDAEIIRDIHIRSIQELGSEAYSQEQVDAWAKGCESADYTGTIAADETEVVVAEQDGTVAGFGTLRLAAPDEYQAAVDAEVTAVYVDPDLAQQGLGTRIYEDLENRARAHDIQTLGLWASSNAVSFYESQDYESVTEHDHEFSGHESTGVQGTVLEMKKDLRTDSD